VGFSIGKGIGPRSEAQRRGGGGWKGEKGTPQQQGRDKHRVSKGGHKGRTPVAEQKGEKEGGTAQKEVFKALDAKAKKSFKKKRALAMLGCVDRNKKARGKSLTPKGGGKGRRAPKHATP